MAEKIVPITLEMFKPRSRDRSRKTNMQLGRFMAEFSGKGCLRVHKSMRLGLPMPSATAEDIDNLVFESIRKIYNLPPQADPQEFYMQQHRQAREVITDIARLFPEASGQIELKDEVTYCSDRPSDLLRFTSRPSSAVDPILAYELQRGVLFAHISGLSNARNLRGRSRSFLADIQGWIDTELFEGVVGAGSTYLLETVHDDETNEVIGFTQDMGKTKPPTAHYKTIPVTVRSIPDIGYVKTSPRKKDDGNVIVKTLVKALFDKKNPGVIDIDSVRDSLGMMFCLMDPHASVEKLSERVLEVLRAGPRRIESVKLRLHEQDGSGQSPKDNFLRFDVQFEDMPTSFELIFRTAEEFVNSQLAVGRRDPVTGYFDGDAHLLYEARRGSLVLPIIFPKEIYNEDPRRPLDLDRFVVNRMRHIAEDLRGRYRS